MTYFIPKTLAELSLVDSSSSLANQVATGLSLDSRKVVAGDIFVALNGTHHRGTDFIESAAQSGAIAALVDAAESEVLANNASIPLIPVDNLIHQVGVIASRWLGNPSQKLVVIGVTGTNGKTSCAHFISMALSSLGAKTAVIGTIGNGFVDELVPASHTTPDPISLQRLLADYLGQGARAVVMEVSSHALDQGRVAGVEFDVATYTNLSRDHLDYHGSMAGYAEAKARLFKDLPVVHRVLNADDRWQQALASDLAKQGIAYRCFGLQGGDLHLDDYSLAESGLQLGVSSKDEVASLATSVIGHFNLANLLLSLTVLQSLGYSLSAAAAALEQVKPVPGRMEALTVKGITAVIDYAHTPDALEKALLACREHTKQDLWVVFGCGGDRDRGKRSEMAKVAAQFADLVVATSDNPRTEDPQSILDDVMQGFDDQSKVSCEIDRAAAIRYALKHAKQGDLVLIAGKGHEDYQEIQGVRHHFSDREQVEEFVLQESQQ